MWSGIARESGALAATVLTSLIYALTHFVSSYHVPPDQIGWHSGIDMLAGSFGAFARPVDVADAYICLFAVGVVLATVRMRTGNIAASLGLHAGLGMGDHFRARNLRGRSGQPAAWPAQSLRRRGRMAGVRRGPCWWGLRLNRFYRPRVSRQ